VGWRRLLLALRWRGVVPRGPELKLDADFPGFGSPFLPTSYVASSIFVRTPMLLRSLDHAEASLIGCA
jgi:hypothetical protein